MKNKNLGSVDDLLKNSFQYAEEAKNAFSNFQIQSPDPRFVHVAYGLMALGAISLLGSPKKLFAVVSAIYMYQSMSEKAKAFVEQKTGQ